jgi:hypothetical protein
MAVDSGFDYVYAGANMEFCFPFSMRFAVPESCYLACHHFHIVSASSCKQVTVYK